MDTYGQNAFYYAVNANQFDTVKFLVDLGSKHDIVDENGQTPIYYAIKQNKLEMIEFLLKLNCNLENTDKRGMTPISFAVRHQKGHLKDLLVEHGSPPIPEAQKKKGAGLKKPQANVPKPVPVNQKSVPKEYVL